MRYIVCAVFVLLSGWAGAVSAVEKEPSLGNASLARPGFQDPQQRKHVIHFWARAVDEGTYDDPQPNISMNQMLVGIDIVIGPGNPGAVGIRHRAAQGSGVQDCTIDATHGHTGLEGDLHQWRSAGRGKPQRGSL